MRKIFQLIIVMSLTVLTSIPNEGLGNNLNDIQKLSFNLMLLGFVAVGTIFGQIISEPKLKNKEVESKTTS